METQNKNVASKGSKSVNGKAAKQQVNNSVRVIETRDQWSVIFDYAVSLVVAYTRGHKPEGDPRKGFAFGSINEQPHSRQYAQSLIGGFLTSKAGKVLKNFDELAPKVNREKIAYAILLDCKLAKDGTEGAKRILSRTEPKRERAFAEAVLAELSKPETAPVTTTSGGKKGGKKASKASK